MGRIAGIARHDEPLGPVEVVERAELIEGQGVAGDFRGTRKAGSMGQNGVVLIEAGDWATATAECGADRALVGATRQPARRRPRPAAAAWCAAADRTRRGGRDHAGMRAVRADGGASSGLRAALTSDWRAGARARVLRGGDVAVGDEIRVEAS